LGMQTRNKTTKDQPGYTGTLPFTGFGSLMLKGGENKPLGVRKAGRKGGKPEKNCCKHSTAVFSGDSTNRGTKVRDGPRGETSNEEGLNLVGTQ